MAEEKQQLKLGHEPNWFLFHFIGEMIVVNFAKYYYGIRVKKDPVVTKMKGPLVVMGITRPIWIRLLWQWPFTAGRSILSQEPFCFGVGLLDRCLPAEDAFPKCNFVPIRVL